VIFWSLSGKSRDDIGAQTKHWQPLSEPLDPRPVGLGRIPVPPHPLQHAVGARLQRCVQVRGQVARGFDQEPRERVVDFGGLDAAKPEADLGDGGDEVFEKLAERRG